MDLMYLNIFVAFYILCIIGLIVWLVYYFHKANKQNKELKNNIISGEFIYYKDFEDNWIVSKYGRKGISGYKYNDTPGCYVITIFDRFVTDGDFTDYENVYVGQSVNICKRVHAHFNGKGNGDVYADIKFGKYVYVSLIPCAENEMNKYETGLIKAFNATESYNATRGGAARRY